MVNGTRRIAVISTSRADYGHLYWPLVELESDPSVDLRLIVTGAHLSPEFGSTVNEIVRDDIPIAERIECMLSSDTDVGMARAIGLATLSLADCLGRMRPDLLLLIADRYEMLAPAAVALALRIPIAHVEGGDVSEGAVDEAVRNALTKLSHLHLTTTETARRRVLAMGEEEWRVHRVGACSLEHLHRSEIPPLAAIESELGLSLEPPPVLVIYHPVTLMRDTTREADALYAALARTSCPLLFCFPNADAGSRSLIERAQGFCEGRSDAHLRIHVSHPVYWGLLRHSRLLIGNSSSGIMEAASVPLPAVDIGLRQRGRERGRNVLHAEADPGAILAAIDAATDADFVASLAGMVNPYGDGTAARRIRDILTSVPLDERLLLKPAVPVPGGGELEG